MKTQVVYFSQTGKTGALAKRLAGIRCGFAGNKNKEVL